MLNWIRKQLHKEDGLTLIELIVVVAIIAILAFTITPRVLDALNNSKINGARSVANELHSSLERYYANEGATGAESYPDIAPGDFDDLRAVLGNTVGLTNTTTNVFDQTNGFDYTAYTVGSGGALTALTGTTAGSGAAYYCITFTARDRTTTDFVITPKGVFEGATTCPTNSANDPT